MNNFKALGTHIFPFLYRRKLTRWHRSAWRILVLVLVALALLPTTPRSTLAQGLLPPTVIKYFDNITAPAVDTIRAGQTAILRFRIENPNPAGATLNNVNFTDGFPPTVVFITPITVTGDCNGGTVTASNVAVPAPARALLSLTDGTIPGGGFCEITAPVTSNTPGTYNNRTGAVNASNALPSTNVGEAILTVLPQLTAPTITKNFVAAVIQPGGQSTLTINIPNPNTGVLTDLTNVNFTDTLPVGLTIASPPAPTTNGNCVGSGTFSAPVGGNAITITNGRIPSGLTCTITVRVVADAARPPEVYTNQIPPGGLTYNGGQNTAPATANLTTENPLTIAKTFGGAFPAGGNTTVVLTITNPTGNPSPQTNVTLTDNLPAPMVIDNPTGRVIGAGCIGGTITTTAGGGTITTTGVTINPGTSCTIQVNVTAWQNSTDHGGDYTNTINPGNLTGTVGSVVIPGGTTSATVPVTGPSIQPPAIAKAFGAATINNGENTTLTFTITNPNVGTPLRGVNFSDVLPAGLVITNPNGLSALSGCGGGTATAPAGGTTISLANAVVTNGTPCTFTVNVTGVTIGGPYTNTTTPVRAINAPNGNVATAPITVTDGGVGSSPLTLAKAYGPNPILAGGISTITFTITNPNSFAQFGATFTDNLNQPPGTPVYIAANPNRRVPAGNPAGCPPAGNLTANAFSQTITLTASIIPANTTCRIQVDVVSPTAGAYVNTTGQISSTNVGPNPGASGRGQDTLTVNGPSIVQPTISKAFGATNIALNGTTPLTFTITNPNDGSGGRQNVALTNYRFVDTFPAGIRLADTTVSGTCVPLGGFNPVLAAGATGVTWISPSLPPGTCTLTINVRGTTAGAYNNQVSVTRSDNSGPAGPGTGLVPVNVYGPPTIAKSFLSNPINAGATTTLQITITNPNANPGTITGVAVDDNLPIGPQQMTAVAGTEAMTASCNVNGGASITIINGGTTVRFTGGSIARNTTCTLTVTVLAPAVGVYSNQTEPVTSAESGPGARGGPVDLRTNAALASLTIQKSFDPPTQLINLVSRMSIRINNPAAATQTNVSFNDPLPAGLVFSTPPNPSGNCNGGTLIADTGTNTFSLSGGTLAAGAFCIVSVDVTSPTPNVFSNSTAASSTLGGTGGTASATVVFIGPPSVVKSFSPNPIQVGQNSTMTLQLTNPNTITTLTGVTVNDILPAGMTVVNPASATIGANCGAASFSPALTAGATVIRVINGGIPGTRTCNISVVVTAGAGTFTNVINPGDVQSSGGPNPPPAATATLTVQDYSLGNRVWIDTNGDGILNGAEVGVGNVTVQLLDSANNVVGTVQTDASGYYRFDNMAAGTYSVLIPAINFQSGRPLGGFLSSTGNTAGTDSRDNGIDSATPATNGIRSGPVTLGPGLQPAGEGDIAGGLGAHGPNGDANDNLTVDFGFVPPALSSIGNRVWTDTNGNGVLDGGEAGVGNVTVQLLDSANNVVQTIQTDATGYYRFDNVAAGTYTVRVAATNFQAGGALNGTVSSTGNMGGTDSRDNGIDSATPATNGIVSGPVTVGNASEPLGEGDIAGGLGAHGPNGDARDNLTVDFGFTSPSVSTFSLGNRVWTDTNGDGILNGAEVGVANVTVQLVDSTNNVIGTMQTDATGYYRFDNVAAGTYSVRVAASNFQAGGALNGTVSSTGNTAGTDSRDNGIDNITPATNGITSGPVTLGPGLQPAGEGDIAAGLGAHGPNGDANDNLTLDFGFTAPAATTFSLGNRVWTDTNGDGILNGAEVGVANVTVQLLDNANNVVGTMQTDATGYYRFDNVPAGTYTVRVASTNFQAGGALNGTVSSTGNTAGTDSRDNGIDNATPSTNGIVSGPVTLGPGLQPAGEGDIAAGLGAHGPNGDASDNLTLDFGFVTPPASSIGNRVWTDTNGNGQLDGGETGVGNVRMELLDSANNVIQTMQTDATGYYRFDNVPAGTYTVRVASTNFQAGGPLNSTVSSTGSTAGTDSRDNGIDNVTPATNGIVSAPVSVGPGLQPTGEGDITGAGAGAHGPNGDASDNLTLDFGFAAPSASTFSLGNRIWTDTNGDGILNGAEVGVANVTVQLLDSANNVVGTIPTDASGYYRFDNIAAGTYTVRVASTNFQAGGPLNGTVSSTGSTAGTDSQDNGIDNVTPATNGIVSAPITLGPGLQPATEGDTTAAGLGAHGPNGDANDNLTADFGFTAPSATTFSVGNRVWWDTNGNGQLDGGEPSVSGVTMQLLDSTNNVIGTVQTDGNGYYRFDNMPAGAYTVRVAPSNFQAGGLLFGSTSSAGSTAGTDSRDNGIDSAAPATNGIASGTITLGPGLQPAGEGDIGAGLGAQGPNGDANDNLTVDFGFALPTTTFSVGNRVWIDTNNNGIMDGGESGIANVTVELLDSTNAAIRTIQTDASGYYRFDNVPAGRYAVRIAAGNFQAGGPLFGSLSSTGSAAGTDSRDNGIDNATPAISGITSNQFVLGAGLQPNGEGDIAANLGAHGPNGDPSDILIVDFGFTTPTPGAGIGAGAGGGAGGGAGAAPVVDVADPAIVKLVEPALALPGETVTYTFVVTNNSGVAAPGVVVTDSVPDVLEVQSASASQGTFGISGNTVTFQVGTVNPGQTVTLRIQARVRPDVVPPVDVTNNARMGKKKASALLRITRGTLPATGEHPVDPVSTGLPMEMLAVVVGTALIFLTIRVVRQRKQ